MKLLKVIILLPLFLAAFSSCVEDDVINPDDQGDARDVYVGTWNCIENEAKIAFTVNITKHPEKSDFILLENFAYIGMGEFAEGEILGPDITVPEQVPCDGYVVKGSGTLINEDKIEWSYTVTAGGDQNNYVATFTRM